VVAERPETPETPERPRGGWDDARAPARAERPLPVFPEPDTEPFWTATAGHRLTYQVCGQCGQVVFYPRRHCPGCTGGELEWRDSAGLGTVYSFTVIRRNGQPFFRARLPYAVGLIDLDEGFRMVAEIDAAPEDVRVNQRVAVSWEDHPGLSVPLFRPEAEA
jgi:uncharacterized OB-fold protein